MNNNGLTLGFADGHSDYYKWREKETRELTRKIRENPNSITNADRQMEVGNEDIIKVQRGVFGDIGYPLN